MPIGPACSVGAMSGDRSGKSFSAAENDRLREHALRLLAAEGGNRTALAKRLGVTQPTVSNFLNGKNGAGAQLAVAIARAAGVSPAWLFTGESAPPNELVVVRDPRYPNLSTAIAFMRCQVKNPEALETVERRALRSHEDPPPLWWAKKIEALDDDLTFEREHPERAAEDEDRADAELRAMEEATTPPIAKQLAAEAEAKKKGRKR